MIAVLVDTTNDAHLLHKVYEGVENLTLLVNPSNDEVTLFAERVNSLIKDNTDLSEWPAILRGQAAMEKDYVRFNYDGLQYRGKKTAKI